jgi:hypothetical protein
MFGWTSRIFLLLSTDLTHFLCCCYVRHVSFLLLHNRTHLPKPQFNIPEGGIIAGNSFGYGDGSPFSDLWEDPEGLFDLSVTGDQFFLYCLNADDEPHFISGFSYNGEWTDAEDLADPAPLDQSALPEDLIEFGSVALPHIDNYLYRGITTGNRTDLLAEFMNPEKYEGSDNARWGLGIIEDPSGARSLLSSALLTVAAIVPLVVALMF